MRPDPDPYDGPIEAINGKRPYNMFLWPTEDWWANGCMERFSKPHRYTWIHDNFDSRWHFGIVALKDGRFATDGSVYDIEKGVDHSGRSVVFDTRAAAIRAAAARVIKQACWARNWTGFGRLSREDCEAFINWARGIVAMETGKPAPSPVKVMIPAPVKKPSGLPLFDFADTKTKEPS